MTDIHASAWPNQSRYYGRRSSRSLPPAHRDVLANHLQELQITVPGEGGSLDPRSLFSTALSEIWLEIGFGAGEHLIGRVLAHPDVGFIGCEPYRNGVASLVSRARRLGIDRIRVFPNDMCLLLEHIESASIDQVFVLFPDPWPKRRHHRRRVIRKETVAALSRILRPGGELLFATDHMDYARWALALFIDDGSWQWRARNPRDWRLPPAGWIKTRYQEKAVARDARCVYLRFQRRIAE